MSEMVERVARAMREHWYAYQICGVLGGDLYVATKEGEQLAGPFKTMGEAEFGRDCVIASAAISAMAVPDLIERLRTLSDEERLQVFAAFCQSCGSADPGCQCWNDE